MASGLHFSSSLNPGNMDSILDKLSQGFTEKERWEINKPAAQVYEKALKYNLVHNLNPTRNSRMGFDEETGQPVELVKDRKNGGYKRRDREDLVNAIDYNKEHGGAVQVGFTRKSEKAYIGRFLNDGWDPRNQHGGPYEHVPGEHFFEKSTDNASEEIKRVEAESLRKVLKRKGL